MGFSFNDNARMRISITGIAATFQPTSAVLAVDGTEYPCTVTTTGSGPYVVALTTTSYFAGPAHPNPNGAVVLNYGTHTFEARLESSDGTTAPVRYPAIRIDQDN